MVLYQNTNFFLGKKWLWTKKPTFPRKNHKKPKKNIFWETIRPKYNKIVFWFSLGKKLVFGGKSNFFLGKQWFWTKKPTFLFPRKNWFSVEKPTFFRGKKHGFGAKNQFFPRENQKKPIFLEYFDKWSPRHRHHQSQIRWYL